MASLVDSTRSPTATRKSCLQLARSAVTLATNRLRRATNIVDRYRMAAAMQAPAKAIAATKTVLGSPLIH